eukprot:11214149-Lingulodinium_polyedra.AAC.1
MSPLASRNARRKRGQQVRYTSDPMRGLPALIVTLRAPGPATPQLRQITIISTLLRALRKRAGKCCRVARCGG